MELEDYSETFAEIDRFGLLTKEDRAYLEKRGILDPKKSKSEFCCPNCNNPFPEDTIKRISNLLVEAIYDDKDKYADQILSKIHSKKKIKDLDSIMFR